MSERKITFPVIKGTNVRRNVETGIEIVRGGQHDVFYAVVIPAMLGERMLFRNTLAEAREAATIEAGFMRAAIAEARDDAMRENKVRSDQRAGSVNPSADPSWVAARDAAGEMTDDQARAYYGKLDAQVSHSC
jgi:hypothetical protein